jgi:hypothetical protein
MIALAACSPSRPPSVEPTGVGSSGADLSYSSQGATALFGNELSLAGYEIRSKDGHTEVELRWSAVKKPAVDYRVFVHALDGSGGIAFQADHDLKDEAGEPTTAWRLGEPVSDRFFVTPWPGHAAGTYTLRLGVFIPKNMQSLAVTNSTFGPPADGRSIIIAHVECR